MTICFDVSNIRSKGAVIIAPTIINYLLSLYPTSQLILLTHSASKIDLSKIDPIKFSLTDKHRNSSFEINRSSDLPDIPRFSVSSTLSHSSSNQSQSIDNLQLDNDHTHSNITHSYGISVSIKTLSGNRYLRFLWMLFLSGRYLKKNDCNHLISLGGYYPGRFRPFSIVIQNLLPFSPDALSLYRYSFPKQQSHSNSELEDLRYSNPLSYLFQQSNIYSSLGNIFSLISNFFKTKTVLEAVPPPLASKIHYFFPLTYIKLLLLRRFTLYSAAKSENVFYFTDKSKEALNRYGINHHRFHRLEIHDTWVPAQSSQNNINTPTPLQPDRLNLLYVAELLLYKNHRLLFDAVNELLKEGYLISLTLIADTHSPQSRPILDYRNSLRFANEITFLGTCPHEKLLKIYPLYDCLVYPSLVESLGIPIYEAIAFRLPIICSNYIDFIPYTDTSSISLFNPLDIKELKNCIKNLYSQKFPKSYDETASSKISPLETFPIELTIKV
jgi:glycosyltransferase involved in cell wall biosynthesis